MINRDKIRNKLIGGAWYAPSKHHYMRWRILRVYADETIAKQFHDMRTDIYGLCKMRQFDLKLSQLVGMFERGKMLFIEDDRDGKE